MVELIQDSREKARIARRVLEALPEWFGIEASREAYIRVCVDQPFFACYADGEAAGFLSLKETGQATAELAVMGVLPAFHRRGLGRALFDRAREYAAARGYSFLQVKTVQMGRYEIYDRTNRFYLSLGFQEFEVFPTLWDERNPCQVYVMAIGPSPSAN